MAHSPSTFRCIFLAGVVSALPVLASAATLPVRLVLQNGRSIPINSLTLQVDKFVVKTESDGFKVGELIPLAVADHVYGEKPSAVNDGIAQLLADRPKIAQKLLEPVVAEQRITASIVGNFWIEAARALLVVYALNGDAKLCADIGKEISDATPAQGADPFVALGKALMVPAIAKTDERLAALSSLASENPPADVSAYASFFSANLYKKDKKLTEALQAYLTVPCVFPSGGSILNAAAELQAADLLSPLGETRRAEAVALLRACVMDAAGTFLVEEANKRLDSLK